MSRGFSRAVLVGNLGRDPEMRYTPSGTPVTNFSIAVNRRRRTQDGNWQDETDWYRVSVFGRNAEVADQYLKRGMKVLVDGQLSINQYTGSDGVERTSVEVRADNFQMLTPRDSYDEAAPAGAGSPGGGYGQPERQQTSDTYNDDDLDDVPF